MPTQKLIHMKSAVADKKPLAEQIDYGQIAVNYHASNPFLSIKTNDGEVVTFPSETAIDNVVSGTVETILPEVVGQNYPTKIEVAEDINALSAATDTKLAQKADKSEIPSLDGYATEQWVEDKHYLTEHQSLDDYYTKEQTSGATEIAEALEGKADKGDVPTDVYTKSETDAAISAATDGLASETWVQSQGYLTEHQSLANYYTKDETSGSTQIASALEEKADTSDIPVVPENVSAFTNDAGYLTEHQSLSNYYTKEEVDVHIANTHNIQKEIVQELPPVESGDTNTIYYVPKPDVTSGATDIYDEFIIVNGRYEPLGNTDVNLDGYATEEWVQEQGYLTEHQSLADYYQKNETSGSTQISEALAGKVDNDAISDMATQTWVTSQGYLTEHQSLDNYYTKSETDAAITSGTTDMATQTWVQSQGYLTQHQSLDNYYTKSETSGSTQISEALALKADATDIPDVSDYFDDAQYDSETHRINFYHGETIKAYIDASPFLVDGMIDNVSIETLSGNTYLVIDFNTSSGKEDILIPITEIFDASNYYTKSEVDDAISGATDDMATKTWVGQQGYLTQHQSLDNYYTKSETSGATEISSALEGKSDTGHTHTVSDITDMPTIPTSGSQLTNDVGWATSGDVTTMLADYEKKAWIGTQQQYEALQTKDNDRLYLITDGSTTVDLSGYYSKSQIDALLGALSDRITALED